MSDPDDDDRGTPGVVIVEGSLLMYWRYGPEQARTLVMLHGLGSDHTGLLAVAAGLHRTRVILPDLPGFGQSPPLPVRHTLRQYARAVEGLRQDLELTRFALFGHSLGADVALAYASAYPAAVSDLCLVNPVLTTGGAAIRLGALYGLLCARLPRSVARPLLSSRAAVYLQDRALFTTTDPATRRRILQQDYITSPLADPRVIHESVRSIRRAPFDRYAQHVRARTLLVSGTLDRLATAASLDRLVWQQVRPQVTVVPGAGHLLPAEQPERVAAIVEEFLDASGWSRQI